MGDTYNVGKLTDFPSGEVLARNVGGDNVAVVNCEGRLHAVSNVCPHANFDLTGSLVQGGEIICNWHFSAFDLATGKVTDGPAGEGLRVYDVEVRGGDVLVTKAQA